MRSGAMVRRKCFICFKELTDALEGKVEHDFTYPPLHALIFTAYGNYGSFVFDANGKDRLLEISICDDCVRERAEHILYAYAETTRNIKSVSPFNLVLAKA